MIDIKPVVEAINWRLEDLLLVARERSADTIETKDLPKIVAYFQELRNMVNSIKERLTPLTMHVEGLSREDIPTIFFNQNTKTITVNDVGRVTVNQRWSATPVDKAAAFQWLRDHDNGGLIQETVHHETLGAVAREAAVAGHPLPDNLFKVSTSNHLSITKV